jgi:endonuclease/exonuclease/phosphatase family metal-dependent hydrolase
MLHALTAQTPLLQLTKPVRVAPPRANDAAPSCPATRSSSLATVRLLTVNIHKGYTSFNRRFMLRELRDAVRLQDSDLVFLQEVNGTAHAPAERQPTVVGSHYEYLADRIWQDHAYGRNAVVQGGDHGNAVLSRFPLVDWTNHDISLPGDEQRGLLHCVVHAATWPKPLHLFCVHLGLSQSHRRQQLAKLGALIASEVPAGMPLVVAGDFNDWRLQADAALSDSGLIEVFRHHFGQHARSFPALWPVLRLDRIYVRGLAAAHPIPLPRQPWAGLSDHAPLAAEIHF